MTVRQNAGLEPVLHAAMTLVAANGLKGLSLRPLADQLGTTVSALTHRFGLKDALLSALIGAAREQDGAFLDIWLARVRALKVRDGGQMAQLADAILADMVGQEALRSRFFCELLQGMPSRPELVTAIVAWRQQRLAFWHAATERLDHPDLGAFLHAFSTDETAHGLAIGELAAYRWLRRLCLHRLCAGLIPPSGATDLREFMVFHGALGELNGESSRYCPPPMSKWQATAARHISATIIADGADSVTHRAIAARAGLPNSTLAYHFPRQEDLVMAGLNDIILRMQGVVERSSQGANEPDYDLSSIEVARATFAVALAATRAPALKGFAADMRRRRGENFLILLNRDLGADSPFDLLSAQTISMTGIGQLLLDGVRDESFATFALADRLRATAFPA